MSERIAILLARPARHVWIKDPAARLDFGVDWSARLKAGEKLALSTFILPGEVLGELASNTATVATVWISGDREGAYEVVNRVETDSGRSIEQAIKLRIKSK